MPGIEIGKKMSGYKGMERFFLPSMPMVSIGYDQQYLRNGRDLAPKTFIQRNGESWKV